MLIRSMQNREDALSLSPEELAFNIIAHPEDYEVTKAETKLAVAVLALTAKLKVAKQL